MNNTITKQGNDFTVRYCAPSFTRRPLPATEYTRALIKAQRGLARIEALLKQQESY